MGLKPNWVSGFGLKPIWVSGFGLKPSWVLGFGLKPNWAPKTVISTLPAEGTAIRCRGGTNPRT